MRRIRCSSCTRPAPPAMPKGVMHTTGGYLVYASMTHQYVFDYHDGDIYWCTADVGWVTGHSYIVYGPLANGATTLMFEGVPELPRCFAFLAGLRQARGQHLLHRAHRASGPDGRRRRVCQCDQTVQEPQAAWAASASQSTRKPGSGITTSSAISAARSSTPGGRPKPAAFLITPLPGATDLKAGSATRPFFGIQPALVDADGNLLDGATDGNLVILDSWPGQMRTVYGDHDRFVLDLLCDLQRPLLHRRRLPPRRGRLLLDHRPGRRCHQRIRPPHGNRGGRIGAGCP